MLKKNKPLTSIIFTSYDFNQLLRNITLTALQSIIKYTDEEDYELIWVDTIPVGAEKLWQRNGYNDRVFKMGQREDRLHLKRFMSEVPDPGQYACYNIGAEMANGDYLCFFQNDVFVGEGWLDNLKWYLDNNKADAVFPDQGPRDRSFVKESYGLKHDAKEAVQGNRDAGFILITREAFDLVGGWDDRYKVHNGEGALYLSLENSGQRSIVTRKSMILHLEHAAGWERLAHDKENYNEDSKISSLLSQGKL